jgi:hypothetical protein
MINELAELVEMSEQAARSSGDYFATPVLDVRHVELWPPTAMSAIRSSRSRARSENAFRTARSSAAAVQIQIGTIQQL